MAALSGRNHPGGRAVGAFKETAPDASGFVLPSIDILTSGRNERKSREPDADPDRYRSGSTGGPNQSGTHRTARFLGTAPLRFFRSRTK
jgi:hypothetical protein